MKKILLYLLKGKKKYAVMFNDEKSLTELKDVLDIPEDNVIINGRIMDSDKILERWEINNATVKDVKKTRNSMTVTVEVDCKLLLRKM
jgi:hypothetical protein